MAEHTNVDISLSMDEFDLICFGYIYLWFEPEFIFDLDVGDIWWVEWVAVLAAVGGA